MSEYITTFTGKHFCPMKPDADLICIEDIAHALSLICRGNGQVRTFWSVGEHCLLCEKEAERRGLSKRIRLACLLHDAAECYLSDVPRPLKKELTEYVETENSLLNMIYEKFLGSSLTEEEEESVRSIDDAFLWYDLKFLLNEEKNGEKPETGILPDYTFRGFQKTEEEFLKRFILLYFGQETLTVQKMREADKYTIEKGTPSVILMKRAAEGIFMSCKNWEGKILVITGSGNNGGDGYALAEILKKAKKDVSLCLTGNHFSEDGKFYYDRCVEMNIPVYNYNSDKVDFINYDILVDCLLGTGFHGIPEEPLSSVIKDINQAGKCGKYIISADINSGMNGDTGEGELAVKSDLTVSIGYRKQGFYLGRSSELIKSLVNVDIGIELPE